MSINPNTKWTVQEQPFNFFQRLWRRIIGKSGGGFTPAQSTGNKNDLIGDVHEWWCDEGGKVCGYAVAGKMIWGYVPPPSPHRLEVIEVTEGVSFTIEARPDLKYNKGEQMNLENIWNKFNEAKSLAMVLQTPADKEKLNEILRYLQEQTEINYRLGNGKDSDLAALTKLRGNEKYLTDRLLDSEVERRESRNLVIFGLVLLNACQMVAVIYFLIAKV